MSRILRKRKGRGYQTVSIIVDGETEVWYLQMMRRYEKLNRISIKPELPKKKNLIELFELVKENSSSYDKVIWIIDFDTIIKEEREVKSANKSKMLKLRNYISAVKEIKNVELLINTPCLEYWYLQHFKQTSKYFNSCARVCNEFKGTVLKDYEKSERYYKRKNNDIYQKLMPFKEIAIANSQKLMDFDISDPEKGKAEIYKIFNLLSIG